MTANEIRNSFLQFFESKGHKILPSASVIPFDDPTLLFTNAGMNQFKDVFLGTGKRDYTRVTDSQKCIRVSGKHNDLEEVGKDTYHHTFFEMLGNWSFGDYYKKEAIIWAWELLTTIWKLPKQRLWATVYKTDDESEQCWKKYTDINPKHILRFGEKDNFWEMGETGPSGPCSEIHIDLTEKGNVDQSRVNAGTPDIIEIWNLVFIQYNRNEKGELEPLPAKHVDTGMGFERVVALLQEKKSNYDTDLFQPLIDRISNLTGKKYQGEKNQVAMRVIADHIRALTFAITDGAIPSNEGRGYVLRRILRRAARFGRNLEMHQPFIYKLVPTLVEMMGDAFPEIKDKQSHIERVIKGEEEGFNQTLERGLKIFESVIEKLRDSKVFPGEYAFILYDTYGFPLDLTQMMAEERGLKVGIHVFNALMKGQKEKAREVRKRRAEEEFLENYGFKPRSRDASRVQEIEFVSSYGFDLKEFENIETRFVGYEEEKLRSESRVEKIVPGNKISILVLNESPFYVESGGQVDDSGVIFYKDHHLKVIDVDKNGKAILHYIQTLPELILPEKGEKVVAAIDVPRRYSIMRNHTATHITHEALRRVLSTHAHQQGSLVAPDRLRFDFNHFEKITADDIRAIEDMVNEKIAEAITVVQFNDPKDWVTIEEAKRRWPNVKMFFGDKYGDRVRVVEIDPKFSVELCGGTHVKNTREIGLFKIISESSIASGIHRIEAVTGKSIDEYIEKELLKRAGELDLELARLIEEKAILERQLGTAKKESTEGMDRRPFLGEITVGEQPTIETIRELEYSVKEREFAAVELTERTKSLKKELSKRKVKKEVSNIDKLLVSATPLDGFKVVSAKVEASTMSELKSIADSLRAKIGSGVGVLGAVVDEKVAIVCVVTDDVIKEKHLEASKIVGAIAKLVGGGGGGRAHLATAGGKDITKLDEALNKTANIVKSMLKPH